MAKHRRSERARARAMAAFVTAIEQGAHVCAAAEAAGVHVSTPYAWRCDVAGFAEAWEAAVAESARPVLIAGGNGRALQKRRTRRVRFTRARKEAFLAHFARTCDAQAAAAAAGVCASTVHKHLRADPAFAEGWQEAMELGHQLLRAELLAVQRAAQERYRVAPAADPEAAGTNFERGLKLLESWQRREDSLARQEARGTGGRFVQPLPPIEDVRERIIRKVEAIQRHHALMAAREAARHAGEAGAPARGEPGGEEEGRPG